ncbi:MAG: hypothetical protein WCW52_03895 [Elusimicrobiales bacterium]|jgi:hypothetical protein
MSIGTVFRAFTLGLLLAFGAANAAAGFPPSPDPSIIANTSGQAPYFQLIPVVTFEDLYGKYYITVQATARWNRTGELRNVLVEGLYPSPPAVTEIVVNGKYVNIDLSGSIMDIGAASGKAAHNFLFNFRKYEHLMDFEPGDEKGAVEYIRGINAVNDKLAEWQRTATKASTDNGALELLPVTKSALSDKLLISAPRVEGGKGYLTGRSLNLYQRVIVNLDHEMSVSKGGRLTSGLYSPKGIDTDTALQPYRPQQAANDSAYEQLTQGAFGEADTESAALGTNTRGAIQARIPGKFTAGSKSTAKPPLPEGINDAAAAPGGLKKMMAENAPEIAGAVIYTVGAYAVSKQMAAHSREGQPGKAVGLGTGFVAAMSASAPLSMTCAPYAAAGGWPYAGCLMLGTIGISSTVEDLSGRFALWYLKNEKKYQPPIPENVKENIKHPIAAVKRIFHP